MCCEFIENILSSGCTLITRLTCASAPRSRVFRFVHQISDKRCRCTEANPAQIIYPQAAPVAVFPLDHLHKHPSKVSNTINKTAKQTNKQTIKRQRYQIQQQINARTTRTHEKKNVDTKNKQSNKQSNQRQQYQIQQHINARTIHTRKINKQYIYIYKYENKKNNQSKRKNNNKIAAQKLDEGRQAGAPNHHPQFVNINGLPNSLARFEWKIESFSHHTFFYRTFFSCIIYHTHIGFSGPL